MDPRVGPAPRSPSPTSAELDEADHLVHAGLNEEQITQTLQQRDQENGQPPRTPQTVKRILAAGLTRARNTALYNTIAGTMFESAPAREETPAILSKERSSEAPPPPHTRRAAEPARAVPDYDAAFGADGWNTWDATSAGQPGAPEWPLPARRAMTAAEARNLLKQERREALQERKQRSEESANSRAQKERNKQLSREERRARVGIRPGMTVKERSARAGWTVRPGYRLNMITEERRSRAGDGPGGAQKAHEEVGSTGQEQSLGAVNDVQHHGASASDANAPDGAANPIHQNATVRHQQTHSQEVTESATIERGLDRRSHETRQGR